MNSKESFSWYVEYVNTPNGVYNRIYRKLNGSLYFEQDVYTSEPVSLAKDQLTYNTSKE